jgi:hypothetical protein
MKAHNLMTLFLLCPVLLACQSKAGVALDSTAYVKTLAETGSSLHVLQLTDIHWNFTTDLPTQTKFLTAVKDKAVTLSGGQLDFIMITGDSLLEANKEIANDLYDLIDGWGIPYGVTFGNHDRQGDWSPEWMSERVALGKNSLYTEVNDDVTGRSNYVINVTKSGKIAWQIYALDSNSYSPGVLTYDYDYIHDDQVAWYEAQADAAKTDNGGAYVPSLAFYHIPINDVFEAADPMVNPNGLIGGEIHEKAPYFYSSSHASKLLDSATAHDMKGMFWGHDHSNDIVYDYKNMIMGYGVKSGTELYYAKANAGYDMTGGALYTMYDNGSFDLEHFFLQTSDTSVFHSWEANDL